jgi:hypothetical protein
LKLLNKIQIDIINTEVLRRVGYKKQIPQGKMTETMQEAINLGYYLAKPLVLYDWFSIEKMTLESITLQNGITLNIGCQNKLWQGAELLSVVLCTIGTELEHQVSKLFSTGKPALAMMLDSVGSVAIDNLETQVQQLLCQEAYQSGRLVGPKLYPGSREWPLEEQQVLFRLLPAERIGIHLNEHCMMIPRKSVSFCSASGQKQLWRGMLSENIANPCKLCQLIDCIYRK